MRFFFGVGGRGVWGVGGFGGFEGFCLFGFGDFVFLEADLLGRNGCASAPFLRFPF